MCRYEWSFELFASLHPTPRYRRDVSGCMKVQMNAPQGCTHLTLLKPSSLIAPSSAFIATVRCDAVKANLTKLLAQANVVPVDKCFEFADKLYECGICDFEILKQSLLADPPDIDVLSADFGMMPAQKRCIMRFLSSNSAQLHLTNGPRQKNDILDCLRGVLSRAKIMPEKRREEFALGLYESGIGDEESLGESLLSNPPDVDACASIGMTRLQLAILVEFLRSSKT
jgi:hypothetical protein